MPLLISVYSVLRVTEITRVRHRVSRVGEKMSARTLEIFMTYCLKGEARVISRILKKNKKTWTGKISINSFNINCIDSSRRSGLMLACIKNSKEVVDLLLSRLRNKIPTLYALM